MSDPDWTIHPGVHWREAIEWSGQSQAAVARAMGISTKHMNQIVRCHVLPSAKHTVSFARHLDLPVGMFWRLRCNYELDLALGRKDLTSEYLEPVDVNKNPE